MEPGLFVRRETTPELAVLLIADISGFTEFMRLHALASRHARLIVVRLLVALVRASKPPLQVVELEGDAVFFYAPAGRQPLETVCRLVYRQMPRLMEVFRQEIDRLSRLTACVCEACTRVDRLKLKQVVHAGEVSRAKIDRFEKLFGYDVIVVHRLLKNTVPSREYALFTEPAYHPPETGPGWPSTRLVQAFEGVGELTTFVIEGDDLARFALKEAPAPPSLGQVLAWKISMHFRTIGDLLGLVRIPGGAFPPDERSISAVP